jgi:hypothetical protein
LFDFLLLTEEYCNAGKSTVDADDDVHKKEGKEPLVVLGPNALVDPDAVMVELFHAHIADSAVLGPRWLLHFACLTLIFLAVHNFVELISF